MAEDNATPPKASEQKDKRASSIEWVDTQMSTSFANVVNVQSTREQVDLYLGVNRSLDAAAAETVKVDLSNRIILTPYAAKRMLHLLHGVLREYESRYGVLKVEDK